MDKQASETEAGSGFPRIAPTRGGFIVRHTIDCLTGETLEHVQSQRDALAEALRRMIASTFHEKYCAVYDGGECGCPRGPAVDKARAALALVDGAR